MEEKQENSPAIVAIRKMKERPCALKISSEDQESHGIPYFPPSLEYYTVFIMSPSAFS